MRIPKANPERYEAMMMAKEEMMDSHGDHITHYLIYNYWRKKKHNRFEWAKDNYINNRALNQAKNIRLQIKDLTDVINFSVVKKFLKKDPIYDLYKKIEKEGKDLSLWKRISMSLCSSFFYNSARRVHNASEDYLLLSEGNMVQMDPNCAFVINKKYPEYIIFTELSGRSSARGIMRNLSEVREEWVLPYLDMIKKISDEKISGSKKKEGKMLRKRKKMIRAEEKRKECKKDKLKAAKERYLNRKKLREKIKN